MATYTIHPIVVGSKVFDKGMMTYQHDYGKPYTIPIYCWHSEGGLSVIIETSQGRAVITGFCVIEENFNPPPAIRGMEMDVIPPGTVVNACEAYDILKRVKNMADILIPLHEPRFASVATIP